MDERSVATDSDALSAVLEAKRLVGNAGQRLDAVQDNVVDDVTRRRAARKVRELQDQLSELVEDLNTALGVAEDEGAQTS